MDVLFNDTAKVSTESEAQVPQADSYSTTTRRTVSLQNGTDNSPATSVSTSNSSGRWTAQGIRYTSQYLLRVGKRTLEQGG